MDLRRTVFVDFEFTRIGEIDTMNEKYYADFKFELTWTENRWIEKYNKETDWNPQVLVENMLTKPDETVEYETHFRDGCTIIIEKRRIKGNLWERMEIQNFPFDVQELSVVLTSKLGKREVKLVPRKYGLGYNTKNTFLDQQKWNLLNFVQTSAEASYDTHDGLLAIPILGYDQHLKNSFSNTRKLNFICYACRRPFYYYANAFFLIFLITLTSLSIFAIDCKLPQNRLQTTATILLTSVSFKWVVNRSLPTVSYTTSLDQYSIICIFYLCLLCAWHGIVGAFWTKTIAVEVDKWILLAFSVFFILIQIYFVIKAFRSYLLVHDIKKRMKENYQKNNN